MINNITGMLISAAESLQTGELQDLTFSLKNISDNSGVTLSVIGYVIVFTALVLLYFFITNLSNFLTRKRRKKLRESGDEKADKRT